MKLRSSVLAISVMVLLFGGILLSNSLGWWLTESSKQAATFSEGDFAGMPDPADIRGSYTFGDVESNFGVPSEVLAQAFGVSTDKVAAFPVKELEALYETSDVEIGTASVRLFVALYSGLPYDLADETTYLPASAVAILQTQLLTAEQLDYLVSHTADLTEKSDEVIASEAPLPTEDVESETLVKGKTTFAEVLSWGVTREQIEQVLGMPIPAENLTVIKDFANQNGLDFETIKEGLQGIVDQTK